MTTIVGVFLFLILVPLALLVLYQWTLAAIAIFTRKYIALETNYAATNRFLVLVPAHNEELCLNSTLISIQSARYPRHLVQTVVIADRCTDKTVSIARQMGVECLERNTGQAGKGSAIAWALDEIKQQGATFDSLVILDADTMIDPGLFEAFTKALVAGYQVQQGYCYISNPWQSIFTRIIAVTSVMRNGLFYAGKAGAGLPGMLAGTGMCFSRAIMDRYGWTAFSVGEDWEFSATLLLAGEKIFFNPLARVFQLESVGMQQASRQRLRWAGGRHAVVGNSVWSLVKKGVRDRSGYLLDAALTLFAPNYSSQAALSLLAVGGAWFLRADPVWGSLLPWSIGVFLGLAAYFLLGVAFTEAPIKALCGIVLIPIFLPWRLVIEILGLLGYGRGKWFRTARISASRKSKGH